MSILSKASFVTHQRWKHGLPLRNIYWPLLSFTHIFFTPIPSRFILLFLVKNNKMCIKVSKKSVCAFRKNISGFLYRWHILVFIDFITFHSIFPCEGLTICYIIMYISVVSFCRYTYGNRYWISLPISLKGSSMSIITSLLLIQIM